MILAHNMSQLASQVNPIRFFSSSYESQSTHVGSAVLVLVPSDAGSQFLCSSPPEWTGASDDTIALRETRNMIWIKNMTLPITVFDKD